LTGKFQRGPYCDAVERVLLDQIIETDYGQFDLVWSQSGGFDGNFDRFFAGQTFDEYCDILGWNVRRARASLTRFVDSGARISGNHLMTAAEMNGAHAAQAVAS